MASTIDLTDVTTYRNAIIIFLLNNSVSKIPIKHSDIIEVVDKKQKAFVQCFPLAQQALKNTYGILVAEVPDSKGAKKYICYSEICSRSIHEYDVEQRTHITLLFLILSYIFMMGCAVTEDQLEDFLKGLKIYFDTDHEYFGSNLKKLITDTFVKQLYLKKEKSESEFDTEVKYLYSWGFRSDNEFHKKDLLEATAKILGKPSSYFLTQYHEAYGDEVVEMN